MDHSLVQEIHGDFRNLGSFEEAIAPGYLRTSMHEPSSGFRRPRLGLELGLGKTIGKDRPAEERTSPCWVESAHPIRRQILRVSEQIKPSMRSVQSRRWTYQSG